MDCLLAKKDQEIDIDNHYRTHTGEEPFGCRICKQRFKLKTSCIRHIRGHDNRFKINCGLPKIKFGQKGTRNSRSSRKIRTSSSRNSKIPDPDIVSKLFLAEEDNHTQAPRWVSNHDHSTWMCRLNLDHHRTPRISRECKKKLRSNTKYSKKLTLTFYFH